MVRTGKLENLVMMYLFYLHGGSDQMKNYMNTSDYHKQEAKPS